MPGFLKIVARLSTILSVATLIALAIAYYGDALPEAVLGRTILFGIPILGLATCVTSVITLVRRPRIQHVLELVIGIVALALYYQHVLRTPI